MKSWLALVALVAFLAGCCVGAPSKYASPDLVDHLRESTAILVRQVDGDFRVSCTGVFVGDRTILTAAHCVDQPADMTIEEEILNDVLGVPVPNLVGRPVLFLTWADTAGKSSLRGILAANSSKILAYDAGLDLAVLDLGETDVPHDVARVALYSAEVGDNVVSMGHTEAMAYSLHPGVVSSVRKMKGPHEAESSYLQVAIGTSFGNSGGGLFNMGGEVVGVCSFLHTNAPIMTFFVDRSVVAGFLEKHKVAN